jgi:hypothetical protein
MDTINETKVTKKETKKNAKVSEQQRTIEQLIKANEALFKRLEAQEKVIASSPKMSKEIVRLPVDKNIDIPTQYDTFKMKPWLNKIMTVMMEEHNSGKFVNPVVLTSNIGGLEIEMLKVELVKVYEFNQDLGKSELLVRPRIKFYAMEDFRTETPLIMDCKFKDNGEFRWSMMSRNNCMHVKANEITLEDGTPSYQVYKEVKSK